MPTKISLDLNATVTVKGKCRDCNNGLTGRMNSSCWVCGRVYSGFDWSTWLNTNEKMPCGHPFTSLNESDEICDCCDGEGNVVSEVSLSELFNAFAQMYGQIYGR